MYYGFKILYDNQPFIELIFRKDFNSYQLKDMIDEIYCCLHSSNKYSYYFLTEENSWKNVTKKELNDFINGKDEIGFK